MVTNCPEWEPFIINFSDLIPIVLREPVLYEKRDVIHT